MKPICLKMTAFGPYAGEQILDFAELKNRSFFLIHGPTGSGKTTILDGICFALYGDTSGAQRDGKSMRSDHADAITMTEVSFTFSIGGNSYRVKRIPEQQRPKKRGEGTTTMIAEAELWNISDSRPPELLTTGWQDVTKKIEALLGFKSSQFRQVVLLPQGDFRKLLTANSSERQEIMQALFKTEFYRHIEETLKDKAQQLRKKFDDLAKQQQFILQEADVDIDAELKDRLQENQQELSVVSVEMGNLGEELKGAQQAVTQGMVIQEKVTEKQVAEQELRKITEQVPLMENQRVELIRATGAARLLDAEKTLQQHAKDVLTLEKAAKDHRTELVSATAAQVKAEEVLAIETANAGEREVAAGELIKLQQIEGKITALTEASIIVVTSQAGASQALAEQQTVAKLCTRVKENMESKTVEQQEYMALAAQVGKWQVDCAEIQRILDKRKSLEDNNKHFGTLAQQLFVYTEKLAKLDTKYEVAKKQLIELRDAWVKGQSAIMAAGLLKNSPCPVCGSKDHPQPAVGNENVPDESQLKTLQLEVENLEVERNTCRNELSAIQTEHNTWGNRVADIIQEIKEQAEVPVSELEQAAMVMKKQYEQAIDAEKKVQKIAEQLAHMAEEQQSLTKKLEQAEQNLRQADNALQAAQAVCNERKLAVPTELQGDGALAKAQETAKAKHQQLLAKWEQAQQCLQKNNQFVVKIKALLESTESNLKTSKERYDGERDSFAERILISGFKDQSDYESAKKTQVYIEKLQEKIAKFDRELNAGTVRMQRATEAIENLIVPDMPTLRQVAEDRQQRYNEILAKHTNLTAQVKRQQAWLKKIDQIVEALTKVEARYAVIGRLAEVANGGNEHKLTLQRFVLGTLLDDVAMAANERLKTMSRGRYYLQRTMDRARKNSAGGLDLEVFDNYTGIARGVGTLSGGETFLASLSLALGLADVVQSYSGGMHLETIFVDEGFGTLDPESLDFAIKALVDLQQGGRLVGIISHVPELKERIDARLEVTLTERGSKACFKVG